MIFRHLPRHIQEVIKTFPNDAEFNTALNNDAILDRLDEEETHKEFDFDEFSMLINGHIYVNGKKYKAITPKVWSYLFITQSPLIQKSENAPTPLDFDIFAYVIENGCDEEPSKIIVNSVGYCKKIGMKDSDIIAYYEKQIKMAFMPMKLFPANPDEDPSQSIKEAPVFDVDWITSLIARVHEVTGLSPKEILNTPLNICCYYFAQWSRIQGVRNIERRSNEEIALAKLERTTEIIVDMLIKKGAIKAEEREDYISKINAKE